MGRKDSPAGKNKTKLRELTEPGDDCKFSAGVQLPIPNKTIFQHDQKDENISSLSPIKRNTTHTHTHTHTHTNHTLFPLKI